MQFEDLRDDFHRTELFYRNSEKLPEKLEKSLNEIAQKEGYRSYKISNRIISTDGGNFLAIIYEVNIKGEFGGTEKETNIFVKQAVPQQNEKILKTANVYSKELFFYNKVSKLFEFLENEASVPQEDRFKCPKFYKESSTDAIILQNLIKKGYGTVHRFNVLPIKLAQLSIPQLARFHALSFVLEQRKPDFFARKIKTLKPSLNFGEDFDKYCLETYKTSVACLDYERKKMMQENFFSYLEHYKKYVNSHESKVRCLCHGDYRMNNILMKTTDGVIDDVIPIDFQHLHYGSPMTDFMYFIFTATDQKFRKNNLDHLKNLYFKTMERYLSYFGITIGSVYPREQFEIDYYDSLKFGLYAMLFLMPVCFILKGDEPDLHTKSVFDITLNVDKLYYDRLVGVIDDLIDYGKL